jgi:hypothetical protein
MPERGPVLTRPHEPARRGPGRRRPDPDRTREAERVLDDVVELPYFGVPGRRLDPALGRDLSRQLGRDLSAVRLHHDRFAADITDALDAEAVTHGDDIYFAPAAGDVTTPAGRALLVHELFHSVHGGAVVGAAPHRHEEAEAERAWARSDDRVALPLTHEPGAAEPAGGADAAVQPGEPAPESQTRAGRWSRLARRTTATLARRRTIVGESVDTPDVVTAGDALVRLVDRLVSRDPADHGGRLRAVLDRLDESLRDAVLTKVVDRNGGHATADLHALMLDRTPVTDGGHSDAQPAEPAEPAESAEPAVRAETTPASAPDAAAPGAAQRADAATAPAPGAEAGGTVKHEDTAMAATQRVEPPPAAAGSTPAAATGATPAPGAPESDAVPTDVSEQAPAPAALAVPAGNLPDKAGAGAPTADAAPARAAQAAAAPALPSAGDASAGESEEPVAAGAPIAKAEETDGSTVDGAAPAAGAEGGAGGARAAGAEADGAETAPAAGAASAGMADAPDADAPAAAESGMAAETEPESVAAPEADGELAEADAAAPQGRATEAGPTGEGAPAALESAPAEAPVTEAPDQPGAAEGGVAPAGREPEDPPEIVNPPAPEDDAQPSLPEPPAPVEAAEAPGADAEVANAPAPEAGSGQPATASTSTAAATDGVTADPAAHEGAEPSGADLDLPADPHEGADAPGDAPAAPGQASSAPGAAPAAPAPSGDGPEPDLADPPAPSGGGGGGGAAIADRPQPAAPDVSGMEPQAALGAVKSLPATKLAASLSGVGAAAQRTVGEADAALVANPPTLERPSGVPADKDASLPPAPLPPLPATTDRTLQPMPGGPGAAPPQPATPPPAGASVTARVPEARVGGDTKITAEDAARIQGAVRSLPASDPALDVDAGPVPELELEGAEDPQRVGDQAKELASTTVATKGDGLTDARADMGENGVLPQVPKETLTATLAGAEGSGAAPVATPAKGGGSAAGGGGGGGAEVPDAAIDAIAEEKSADEIDGATTEQGGALGAARDEHESSVQEAKTETDRQINDEIAANGGDQTEARRAVRADVGADRKAWVGEQDGLVGRSGEAADAAQTKAGDEIGKARAKARTDAGNAVQDGNQKIVRKRQDAEREAREKRAKAEKESEEGGFFSWLGSKVKSFFDAIKSAIHAVFELARAAVDLVISTVQKVAVAAIELGRKVVVGAIELGGKALAAAGDIVLAGFPEARAKFRKKIEERVDAAKKIVNDLADGLKAGVTKLLDGLGKLLKGALSLLEKAYTAAIDIVAKTVDTVIKSAKAFVDALADFAALIADIAANPGQWLSNLGASLMDGVRHHVWPSLVKAVKDWFKSKVEEVVGVGKLILEVLKKGGINFAKIVTMAWTAIKESLPGILIGLLIEKLVAMLIPAGGALSLIIDGLKAAWGAASRILAAFQKFIAFLKAVKAGNAGPQFGAMVGAVAVAVMDFLANFVLSRLKGAGQKVGGTLRKMAEKFMKFVKKIAGVVKKGAKAAAGAVKRAVIATVQAIKKGAIAAGKAIKKGAAAAGRMIKKVLPKGVVKLAGKVVKLAGKAVKFVVKQVRKVVEKVKATYKKVKEKLFGKKKGGKPKETAQGKLDRVISVIGPQISGWFGRGIGRIALFGGLKILQGRHLLRSLRAGYASDGAVSVRARVNPEGVAALGWSPKSELRRLVGEVAEELLRDPEVLHAAEAMRGKGSKDDPVPIKSGADYLAAAHISAADVGRGQTTHYAVGGAGTPVTVRSSGRGVNSDTLRLFEQQQASARASGGVGSAVSPEQADDLLRLLPHRKVGRGGDYNTTFPSRLKAISARATPGDVDGAQALVGFMQSGAAHNLRQPERQQLAGMATLMFTTETTRDPSHLADVAFATDLVGQKRGRLSEVIGGHPDDVIKMADLVKGKSEGQGGILPMSPKGAQRHSFLLQGQDRDADIGRLLGPGSHPESIVGGPTGVPGSNQERAVRSQGTNAEQHGVSNMAHSRMLLAERWVEMKMQVDPEAFKDRAAAKSAIERHLREFYKLAIKAPSPSVPMVMP